MRALIALLLVACEQAPPSEPPSPPSPITPAPTPIVITPAPPAPAPELQTTVLIRLTPTQLTANGKHLLDVAPSTPAIDLDRATFAALSQMSDRSARVIIEADKSLAYATVLALLEASQRAGYTRIAFSVAPSP